jgi:hypothetical protein
MWLLLDLEYRLAMWLGEHTRTMERAFGEFRAATGSEPAEGTRDPERSNSRRSSRVSGCGNDHEKAARADEHPFGSSMVEECRSVSRACLRRHRRRSCRPICRSPAHIQHEPADGRVLVFRRGSENFFPKVDGTYAASRILHDSLHVSQVQVGPWLEGRLFRWLPDSPLA